MSDWRLSSFRKEPALAGFTTKRSEVLWIEIMFKFWSVSDGQGVESDWGLEEWKAELFLTRVEPAITNRSRELLAVEILGVGSPNVDPIGVWAENFDA